MHIVYLEDGNIRQCSQTTSVPAGVEYWHVTPDEKDFMYANRANRDAWIWNPQREPDGVGQ